MRPQAPPQALYVTFFPDVSGSTLTTETIYIWDLRDRILATAAASKEQLGLLKLATFGDKRSGGGSLRNNANIAAINGVEGDYDGGQVDYDEAVRRLRQARIRCLIYTSPSHTSAAPRWRVLAPTSNALAPVERSKLVARLNGVLGGILANESFTLSQSFYYGKVDGNAHHRCDYYGNDYIDQRQDLDAEATAPARRTRIDQLALTDVSGIRPEEPITSLDDARLCLPVDVRHMIVTDTPPTDAPHLKGGKAHCRVVGWLVRCGLSNAQVKQVYRLGRIQNGHMNISPRGFDGYLNRTIAFCRNAEEAEFAAYRVGWGDAEPVEVPRPEGDAENSTSAAPPDTEAGPATNAQGAEGTAQASSGASGSSSTNGAGTRQTGAPHLPWVNMQDWDSTLIPEREWAVHNRIPMRQVFLLSGEGAVGKSIIELQLCVAHVLGRDWLRAPVKRGPAIYYGCEDEPDELRRRLAAIAQYYGTTFTALTAGGLHLLSFVDNDPLLAKLAPFNTGIERTLRLTQMFEVVSAIKPVHIGLDTSADVFGGNENERAHVRRFVSGLRNLARAANGSVVLIAHPSLTGISTGTGLSGNTGWHNSVRARAYFRPPKLKEGEQPNSDVRELEFKKNNYGPVSENIVVRWQDGVFVPVQGSLDQAAREEEVKNIFITLLRKFIGQRQDVSPSPSRAYAPTLFAADPGGAAYRSQEYARAMQQLFDADQIHITEDGPPSRRRKHLAVGPTPTDQPF